MVYAAVPHYNSSSRLLPSYDWFNEPDPQLGDEPQQRPSASVYELQLSRQPTVLAVFFEDAGVLTLTQIQTPQFTQRTSQAPNATRNTI